jgi:hypothetical protein
LRKRCKMAGNRTCGPARHAAAPRDGGRVPGARHACAALRGRRCAQLLSSGPREQQSAPSALSPSAPRALTGGGEIRTRRAPSWPAQELGRRHRAQGSAAPCKKTMKSCGRDRNTAPMRTHTAQAARARDRRNADEGRKGRKEGNDDGQQIGQIRCAVGCTRRLLRAAAAAAAAAFGLA